jgi:hypothetical protein
VALVHGARFSGAYLMALTVDQLIDDAARELQDEAHVRWSRAELLDYFNAAQRTFAEQRPDQLAQELALDLVAGWRQQLPAQVHTLIDITHNLNTTQRRITKTNLWVLDAVSAAWRALNGAREVQHFMHDMRAPREFLVYPPVMAGVRVSAMVQCAVLDLASEVDAPAVPARWMDALRHFVLYRAWSKDAEYGGNATLAAAHLQLFNNMLGVQSKAANEMAPTV